MTATMTTNHTRTGGRLKRPLLPLANLALAGAALTVSLIAITSDDDPAAPAVLTPQVVTPAADQPAGPVSRANAGRGTPAGDCLTRAIVVRC